MRLLLCVLAGLVVGITSMTAGGDSPKRIPLHPQTGSPYNDVTMFEIEAKSNAISIADTGESDVLRTGNLLLNTGQAECWVERGAFAHAAPRVFQPEPEIVAQDAIIELFPRAVLQTNVTVKHEFGFTFHRGAGQVGASLGSDFTRRFKEFTVKPGKPLSELLTGPKNEEIHWHGLQVLDGQDQHWLVAGAMAIGVAADFETVFRFNTGSSVIELLPEMHEALVAQITASGGVVSQFIDWMVVDDCEPELVPAIVLQFGNDIPVQRIELPITVRDPTHCILPVVISNSGYVELGRPFLRSVQVHFDSEHRAISFVNL